MPINPSIGEGGQGNPSIPGSPGQPAETTLQTPRATPVAPVPPPPLKVALAPAKDRPSHGQITIISRYGELVPLASRVGATLYFTNSWYRRRNLCAGIASIADTLQDALRNRPAAVIFDHTGDADEKLGPIADGLRARGLPVWDGGEVHDLLEANRAFGLQVALRCGLNIPRTLFFDRERGEPWPTVNLAGKQRIFRIKGGLDEAKSFVAAVGGRWVLKPYNTAAASLTFVAESAEQMSHRLAHAEEMGELKANQRFLLQEFISGIEVSTEFLVSQGEVVALPNGTIETKKAFAHDTGPVSGCATSLVWIYDNDRPLIVRHTLGRPEFLAWLKKPTGPGGRTFPPYSGAIDVNVIISDVDHLPYVLEWTPRGGYNAIFAHLALVDGDLRKIFTDLAHARTPDFKYRTGEFGFALRVMIPPAPFADGYIPPKGTDNWAFAEKLMKPATHVHVSGPLDDPAVWLTDVQTDPAGGVRTAGCCDYVMELTSHDAKIEECAEKARFLFEAIDLPDAFARVGKDGVKRACEDTQKLLRFGYEVPNIEIEHDEPAPDVSKEPRLRPLVPMMEKKAS